MSQNHQVRPWLRAGDFDALVRWTHEGGEPLSNLMRRVVRTYLAIREFRNREERSVPTPPDTAEVILGRKQRVTLWLDDADHVRLATFALADDVSVAILARRVLQRYVEQRLSRCERTSQAAVRVSRGVPASEGAASKRSHKSSAND